MCKQGETQLFLIGAFPESVPTFRGDLVRAFVNSGLKVTVMAANGSEKNVKQIEGLPARFLPYRVDRNGVNPLNDLQTFMDLVSALRDSRPEFILAYTVKPVVWGGIAARRVPDAHFVALITGLGYAFQTGGFMRKAVGWLVARLYRFSLRRANAVIFQNSDNRDTFVARGIVALEKCHVVAGSGVDTSAFACAPFPDGPPRFLLIARMLGDKGIREYIQAANRVKQSYPEVQFDLLGPGDPSPDGIPIHEINAAVSVGDINYLGSVSDVRPFIAACHVYVLPSYHEGMPRSVLEAMAMGRPILTTDVVGCRETVREGVNGWLVQHQNVDDLEYRLLWFIENRDQWKAMGRESRLMAETLFDVDKVNSDMLEIMDVSGTSE